MKATSGLVRLINYNLNQRNHIEFDNIFDHIIIDLVDWTPRFEGKFGRNYWENYNEIDEVSKLKTFMRRIEGEEIEWFHTHWNLPDNELPLFNTKREPHNIHSQTKINQFFNFSHCKIIEDE
jgi:hypothetical protein